MAAPSTTRLGFLENTGIPQGEKGNLGVFQALPGSNATDYSWEVYKTIPFDDSYNSGPVGFDNTNRLIYWIDSTNVDRGARDSL